MGLEVVVPGEPVPLSTLLERLATAGVVSMIAMVDGALRMPGAPPPADWREVRLRTPAGTVSLVRRGGGVAVVVFGNADEPLRAVQAEVARALAARA